jgi:hypothetical protein
VRKVFVSYARANRPHVEQLVEHLGVLDCQTWFDSSLRGGQDWWEQILDRISDCDVFIAIISREALNSVACEREFEWAEALGKPVLPVALQPPSQALPQRFSRRHIVDYSDPANRDRAALTLAGGLAALPVAPALPQPLPDAPSAPLSYLTELVDRVSTPGFLDHDQQRQILFQLEAAVRSVDPEERRGGRDILERFSSRDDLYADVDRMITLLKGSAVPETDAKTVVAEPPGPGPVKTTQPATETEPTAIDATLKTEPSSPTPLTGDSDQTPTLLADRPPPDTRTPPPQPWWRRQRRQVKLGLIAAVVVILAAGATVGYLLTGRNSQPAATVTPVAAAALDGLLLSPDQINTAMGGTGMTVTKSATSLWENSANVADKDCLFAFDPAEAAVYAGSGWSAMRGQEVGEPGDNVTHFVSQAVVLFPFASDAAAFFTTSAQRWPACHRYTITSPGQPDSVWTAGAVTNTNGTLSASQSAEGGNGYACQRALTVANNVAIDVMACSNSPADSGVDIAHQIAAKVPT